MTDAEIIHQFDMLLSDPSYIELRKLKADFCLFDFLGSMNENATSQAICFLLDSDETHGLGALFASQLMDAFYEECKGNGFTLTDHLAFEASNVSAETEWQTSHGNSRRRLDILVRLSDNAKRTTKVFGIENKHGAPELENQIADYQKEIEYRFPTLDNQIIFFLTPTGRDSLTRSAESKCKCIPVSYKAVCDALCELEKSAVGEIGLIVSSLKNHLLSQIVGSTTMNDKARQLVKALYENPNHRRTIRLIIENLPTFGAILEQFQFTVGKKLRDLEHVTTRFEIRTYPAARQVKEKLQEIYLDPVKLNEQLKKAYQFEVYYLIHPDRESSVSMPGIGDKVYVQLAAWCHNELGEAELKKLDLARGMNFLHTRQEWARWKTLVQGRHIVLQDMGAKDVEGLNDIIFELVNETLPKLESNLRSACTEIDFDSI